MATSRTVIGLQARLESTRLPGKVLLPFAGTTILQTIVRTLSTVEGIDELWVVTGEEKKNRELIDFCADQGIPVLAGDEADVQSRYIALQEKTQADYLIRATADNPLVQADMTGNIVALLKSGKYDYVSNCLTREFPLGLNVEGFSASALAKAREDATPDEKEHVTLRFKLQPGEYSVHHIAATGNLSWPALRLTVDEQADYDFLTGLYDTLGDQIFDLSFLIDYLLANRQIISNSHIDQVAPQNI